MYNINMAMYEQMGFTKEQVTRAHQFSQQNNIDIFDALQYLQRNPTQTQRVSPQQKNKLPNSSDKLSLLESFKNIDLKQYEIVFSTKNSRLNLSGKQIDLRQEFSPVGLLNVYNCCYLNSLLQCYFLSTNLMKYIFLAEPLVDLENLQQKMSKVQIKRIKNSYNFLETLKEIFAKMCLTSRKYIDPTQVLRNLVNSIGEKIQYGEEKDLFETNISLIERLNQCLLYTKNYYKHNFDENKNQSMKENELNFNENGKVSSNKSANKERDNIKHLFYGKKVQFTDQCGKNHSPQEVVSDFLGIIINPTHGNLYKAIYEEFHYDVEIEIPDEKRKIKTKKHTYIRQVPEYLYFYINRTGYNARQQQALKNAQKISFDFEIYLDSFLEKYRKEITANMPLIIELWRKKNELKKKINSFQIFSKKLEQCRQLASSIDGWKEKLPNESQVQSEKKKIEQELRKIQKELQKIESRKQKYCLMYIFVHRGDAVSGHYWGYGRNAGAWYKFDTNTKKIKQQQILLDFYKSGGTPYALVYVKQDSLPYISYHYYKDFSQVKQQNLIDLNEQQEQLPNESYLKFIPQGMKKVIISENVLLHQDSQKRKNLQITHKLLAEYLTRYSYIENLVNEKNKYCSVAEMKIFPSYDNFALYLWMKDLKDFAKYNIFSTSLKTVANITTTQMLENQTLLKMIQKQFKKKIKRNKTLKHYCIQFEPKEGEHYKKEWKNFLVEKGLFTIVMNISNAIEKLESCKIHGKVFSNENMTKVNNIIKRAVTLVKSGSENISYVKHVFREIIPIALLKLLREKCLLKMRKDDLGLLVSENIINQLQMKGFKQSLIMIEQGSMKVNQPSIIQQSGQDIWLMEEIINKGLNRQMLEKKIKSILKLLESEINIYQQVQKSGKVIQYNQQAQNSNKSQNISTITVVQQSLI